MTTQPPTPAGALPPGWREFLEFWMHEGHLQTFGDRERFRGAARLLLSGGAAPAEFQGERGSVPGLHVPGVRRNGYTRIFRNASHRAWCDLALRALDTIQWRHHGIGVLQAYLAEGKDPEIRIHIWSRRLLKPGMDVSGDAHDHRFHMISHVLCGTVAHEELTATLDDQGDHKMLLLTHARAAADNNFHGPTTEAEGTFRVARNLMRISAGSAYAFPALHFHRSPLLGEDEDIAVTVVEKHRQEDVRARILYPAAKPPVMAFGHQIDAGLVRSVVECAREALRSALR